MLAELAEGLGVRGDRTGGGGCSAFSVGSCGLICRRVFRC